MIFAGNGFAICNSQKTQFLRYSKYFITVPTNAHLGGTECPLEQDISVVVKIILEKLHFPPPSYHLIACFEVYTLFKGRHAFYPMGLLLERAPTDLFPSN